MESHYVTTLTSIKRHHHFIGFEKEKKEAQSMCSAPLVFGQYPLGWVWGGNMLQSAEVQNRHCKKNTTGAKKWIISVLLNNVGSFPAWLVPLQSRQSKGAIVLLLVKRKSINVWSCCHGLVNDSWYADVEEWGAVRSSFLFLETALGKCFNKLESKWVGYGCGRFLMQCWAIEVLCLWINW